MADMMVGLVHGPKGDLELRGVPVDTYKIIVKEIDMKGEISQMPYDWQTAIHLVSTGRVRLKPLVTHTYGLEDWEEAFDMAATSADCLRVALMP